MKFVAVLRLMPLAFLSLIAQGCGSDAPANPTTTEVLGTGARRSPLATAAPSATLPKQGEEVAVLTTNFGRIVWRFLPDKAPNTVANFKKLANSNFYDGTKFHRVVPKYLIQGGDPLTKGDDRSLYGKGDPGYFIKGEMNDFGHKIGSVSMARQVDRDSAGCQFFIMVADHPELDPDPASNRAGYTVFAQVIEGMNVVGKIVNLPHDNNDVPEPANPAIVESVRIMTWPLKD